MAQSAEQLTLNEEEPNIGDGTCTGTSSLEDDLPSDCECPDFCGEFLESLPEETKGKVVHLMHSLLQKKIDVVLPSCETILKELEKTYGIESFIYGQILKQIVLALNRTSHTDEAIKLVEHRLCVMNSEDFTTLIILGIIYDKKGDYQNAMETYRRANDSANQNSDNLQGALSLVKLATSFWNLEQPDQSRQFRDKGLRTFEQSGIKNVAGLSPEVLIFLLDYYKTVGYLHKVNQDFQAGRICQSMTLDVIKKNGCSRVQELKTLSWLAHSYATSMDIVAVDRYNARASHIVEEMINNPAYISAHASQLIHIMSRIAFAYTYVDKREAALEVREKGLAIARKFLGDSHPEVARTAADIIFLCYKTNQPRRADEFCDIYEKSLEECRYKSDENILKLYVREISDALNNFAFACILQSNYSQAEEAYKESLEINKKVYGNNHPRTSKVLRFMGRTYNKWGKHEMAKEMFRASLSIVEQYQPDDTVLQNSIRKELALSGKSRRGHVNKYMRR